MIRHPADRSTVVRTVLTLTLLAAASLWQPVPLVAQRAEKPDSTASLVGQVVSAMTGGPLPNAQVVLKVANRGVVTDSSGEFALRDVPAGPDTVKVRLIGFAEEQVPLTLKPDRTTRVTFLLSETVLKVEDITVEVERRRTGKLAGFEERRKRGFGHFITPEEIEDRNPQETSDLLRGVPGVSVGPSRLGGADVRITRRAVGNCEVTYWVDGQPLNDYNIDEMNRDDVLAMEIYRGPSETPQRFHWKNRGCGTIVIWTREGRRR